MSICNIILSRRNAIVVVDTEAVAPTRRFTSVSKAIALPAARAVLAGRGHIFFLATVAGACVMRGFDFDEMAEDLPAHLLEPALADLRARFESLGCDPGFPAWKQEIVLVGWSARTGGLHAVQFAGEKSGLFRRTWMRAGEGLASPGGAGLGVDLDGILDEQPTDEQLVRLARAQQAAARRSGIPAGGGTLLRTDLTAAGIAFREIANLEAL